MTRSHPGADTDDVLDCPTCDGEGVLAKDIEAHERATGCEQRHDIDDDGPRCHCGVMLPSCPGCADYSLGRRRPESSPGADKGENP